MRSAEPAGNRRERFVLLFWRVLKRSLLAPFSSLLLLSRAYRRVHDAGYEVVNAHCVLIGERPKVAERRAELVVRLAETLGVEPDRIAVSGTTTDRLGFTGRGEGLAAQAVVLLRQRD